MLPALKGHRWPVATVHDSAAPEARGGIVWGETEEPGRVACEARSVVRSLGVVSVTGTRETLR